MKIGIYKMNGIRKSNFFFRISSGTLPTCPSSFELYLTHTSIQLNLLKVVHGYVRALFYLLKIKHHMKNLKIYGRQFMTQF